MIATAVTVPLLVIALFAISAITGSGGSGSPKSPSEPGALSFSAPPNVGTQATACAKVLAALPVKLVGLDPRVVHTTPETPYVVAWGDPAIVLRCGVDRPKALEPYSSTQFLNGGAIPGPYYDIVKDGDANVWTTVDRSAYISITVPRTYNSGPLPSLSRAIQKALPAVCSTRPTDPVKTLCTRRT